MFQFRNIYLFLLLTLLVLTQAQAQTKVEPLTCRLEGQYTFQSPKGYGARYLLEWPVPGMRCEHQASQIFDSLKEAQIWAEQKAEILCYADTSQGCVHTPQLLHKPLQE